PVLTTPPPVEPNTVFVLMSVPEMMLSSNLVALRRRAATIPPMPARIARPPTPIAHPGMLPEKSSKNPGGSFALALTGGVAAGAAGAGAFSAAGAGVGAGSGAFAASATFGGSGAFAGSAALGGSATFGGSGVVVAVTGGVVTGGGGTATATS